MLVYVLASSSRCLISRRRGRLLCLFERKGSTDCTIRRRTPVFATKGNPTVRENISNVFGAKALSALVPMNLEFEMKPTRKGFQKGVEPQ